MAAFASPGALEPACRELAGARRVLIVTGFPVLATGRGETDGPPGAVTLGQALTSLGVDVIQLTCPTCAPLLQALAPRRLEVLELPPGMPPAARRERAEDTLRRLDPSHLVAIERPGRAADGEYRDMRARTLSGFVHALDELLLVAPGQGVTTVAVGDGGNEAGFGARRGRVAQALPQGAELASVVPADHLVVSGVSTWGAYGLAAGVALARGRPPELPDAAELSAQLDALLAAGAVDGVSGRSEPTIDGLPLTRTLELLDALRLIAQDPQPEESA